MARLVKDVMTAGAAAVRPDASLVEAARLMRDLGVGDVLVADGDSVVGLLTDRDIALRCAAEGADPAGAGAASVCTPAPVFLAPDDTVPYAVALMRRHAVRRLPVVRDGRPLGLVTAGDLAAADDSAAQPACGSRTADLDERS